jgi:6-phosphogluconolactonase
MRASAESEVRTLDDAEALAAHAAQWLCALACASAGDFAICLSGGSTPRRLYQLLAEPPIARRFPWSRVHWFWGDERCVPHDDPASNYGMARAALFSRVVVAGDHLHPVPTEGLSPRQAAEAYDATLKAYYGARILEAAKPLFDVTLLGLGEDGHTASLFPGQPALDEHERWAVEVAGARPQPRVTLTYPALDSSRDVAFLVSGAAKRSMLARARGGDRTLPAARIAPVGRLHWLADRAAAGAA